MLKSMNPMLEVQNLIVLITIVLSNSCTLGPPTSLDRRKHLHVSFPKWTLTLCSRRRRQGPSPPLNLLLRRLLSPTTLRLIFLVALILRTPTIIEITDITAIKQRLFQTLVDFVVDVTAPCSGGAARGDLGRELLEDGAKVGGALAAATLQVSIKL
jgi:hypothetical protein